MNEEQYKVICTRRQGYDSMLWRAPTLAVAAQAFLMAIARNPDFAGLAAFFIYFAAFLVGLAALYLFAMLRVFEKTDSRLLEAYERTNAHQGYSVIHVPLRQRHPSATVWYLPFRTFFVWACILGIIAILSFTFACNELLALIGPHTVAQSKTFVRFTF